MPVKAKPGSLDEKVEHVGEMLRDAEPLKKNAEPLKVVDASSAKWEKSVALPLQSQVNIPH